MACLPPGSASLSAYGLGRGRQGKYIGRGIMQRLKRGQVFVLLAPGFEEIDVSTVTSTLRHSGFAVALVSLASGPVRGAYGVSFAPDGTLSEVETEHAQAVVLPGGIQGARQLGSDPRVHTLLRRVIEQGGYVVALSTSYMVLRSAGILNGTEQDVVRMPAIGWRGEISLSNRILVDGQVIFARDSGAAQESALTLIVLLEGRGM